MADVTVLDVLLYDEPIGTLTRFAGDRSLFAFTDAYIEDADRPVLGLSFKDQFGELITEFKPTRTRIMPFFSNLLPEGHMRTYLAERAGINPLREFFLLWILGIGNVFFFKTSAVPEAESSGAHEPSASSV